MSLPAPRSRVLAVTPALFVLALLAIPVSVDARQTGLPDEVRTWLERDQIRRWTALVAEGDSIFASGTCVRCHGTDATGSQRGPDLTDDVWSRSDGSLEGIRLTIFWGVRPEELSDGYPFSMNPAGSMHLDPGQYDALAAYVWTLSHPPG